MHLAHLAALALDLVAQDVGVQAGAAGQRGGGFQAGLRRGDHAHLVAGKQASPGLGVSKAPLSSPARAASGQRDAVARQIASASAQVLASGTVGPLAMTWGRRPARR
jgi:hypothetical protein